MNADLDDVVSAIGRTGHSLSRSLEEILERRLGEIASSTAALSANNTKVIGGLSRWICFLLVLILAALVAIADGGA